MSARERFNSFGLSAIWDCTGSIFGVWELLMSTVMVCQGMSLVDKGSIPGVGSLQPGVQPSGELLAVCWRLGNLAVKEYAGAFIIMIAGQVLLEQRVFLFLTASSHTDKGSHPS
jgi:hypothetical protein